MDKFFSIKSKVKLEVIVDVFEKKSLVKKCACKDHCFFMEQNGGVKILSLRKEDGLLMKGLDVFYVQQQHIFACESLIFDELLIIDIGQGEMFLMFEVATYRQPRLPKQFLYFKIITDDAEDYIQIYLILIEVLVYFHVCFCQIIDLFFDIPEVLVKLKGLLEIQPALLKFIHLNFEDSLHIFLEIIQSREVEDIYIGNIDLRKSQGHLILVGISL